ncbi:hypothetical protein [Microbacterium xylanilyticum]
MLRSVDSRRTAGDLAELIVDTERAIPLIVVTTPSGRDASFVPLDDLDRAVGSEADIAAVSRQASNWLSDRLTELGHPDLHVYGGATRLYPAGSIEDDASPLFTARTRSDGDQVVRRLQAHLCSEQDRTTVRPDRRAARRAAKSWKPRAVPSDAEAATDSADDLLSENRTLRTDLQASRKQLEVLTRQLSEARQESSKLRKRDRDTAPSLDRPARFFLDAGDDISYRIHTTWAAQVPAEQKPDLALAMFTLGEEFSASVDEIAGADATLRDKIARACVRVLTRQDRDAHKLGEERDDGAVAWRSYVEQKSPSARRLHYWAVPGGTFVLARIVVHDDYRI